MTAVLEVDGFQFGERSNVTFDFSVFRRSIGLFYRCPSHRCMFLRFDINIYSIFLNHISSTYAL